MTDGGTELKILQNKGNIEYSLASLSKTISMVSVNEVNKMMLFYLSLSIFFVFVIVIVFVFAFTCSRERVRGMRVFAVELLQVGQAEELLNLNLKLLSLRREYTGAKPRSSWLINPG